MSSVNLTTLQELRAIGAPQFFDTDPVSIKRRLVAKFEADTKKTLYEGQPEMFMIETMAYSLSVRSSAEQNAVLQNTIVWSEGRHIEDNAANVSIFRIKAQPARTTMRVSIEAARLSAVSVEKGTQFSGGTFVFQLDEDAVIAPGELATDVPASAVVAGVAADGIAAFVINQAVDELPDGVTAHNITVTFGGSDDEDLERLRERAANGNFRISKGGPRNGYREIVKAIHPDIVAVSPIKPQPGYIEIYPLMKTGLPSQEIKDLILQEIDPEEDVPMGDYITVNDLTPVSHDFTLIIRIDAADNSIEGAGRAKVEEVFSGWSKAIGIRVSPSVVTSEVRQLRGVVDAEVDGLEFADLTDKQYAVLGDLTIDIRVAPDE